MHLHSGYFLNRTYRNYQFAVIVVIIHCTRSICILVYILLVVVHYCLGRACMRDWELSIIVCADVIIPARTFASNHISNYSELWRPLAAQMKIKSEKTTESRKYDAGTGLIGTPRARNPNLNLKERKPMVYADPTQVACLNRAYEKNNRPHKTDMQELARAVGL